MKGQRESRERSWVKPVVISCLCLGLLIVGVLLFFSYRENRQHRESIVRFGGYCLQMDETFCSVIKKAEEEVNKRPVIEEKTIEIMDSASGKVQSIELGEIDSGTLQSLLDIGPKGINSETRSGTQYTFDYLPNTIISVFQKYENGTLVWETDLQIVGDPEDYVVLEEGIFVALTEEDPNHRLHLFFIENDGRIRWEYRSKRELSWGPKVAVSDGILHVVCHNDRNMANELIILTFDLKGNLLSEKTREWEEKVDIVKVVATKDGYAVRLFQHQDGKMVIRKMSSDGELLGRTTFTLGGHYCIINDILYYDGKMYVSIRCLNKPSKTFYDTEITPFRTEYLIAYGARGYGIDPHDFEMGEEFNTKVTDFFKEQYTAAVFILDEKDGVSGVCTVEGASAGDLSFSEQGEPVWQVFRIDHARFGVFSVSSNAYVYSTEFAFEFNDGVWGDKRQVGYKETSDLALIS